MILTFDPNFLGHPSILALPCPLNMEGYGPGYVGIFPPGYLIGFLRGGVQGEGVTGEP